MEFFAPSPLLRVRSWLHPFYGHCEQQAMRDEGAHLSLLRQRHNMKGNDSTDQGKTKHNHFPVYKTHSSSCAFIIYFYRSAVNTNCSFATNDDGAGTLSSDPLPLFSKFLDPPLVYAPTPRTPERLADVTPSGIRATDANR